MFGWIQMKGKVESEDAATQKRVVAVLEGGKREL